MVEIKKEQNRKRNHPSKVNTFLQKVQKQFNIRRIAFQEMVMEQLGICSKE